jgi:hypothetical protein
MQRHHVPGTLCAEAGLVLFVAAAEQQMGIGTIGLACVLLQRALLAACTAHPGVQCQVLCLVLGVRMTCMSSTCTGSSSVKQLASPWVPRWGCPRL